MKHLVRCFHYSIYLGPLLLTGCLFSLSKQQNLAVRLSTPQKARAEGSHYQVDFSQNSIALLKSHFSAYPGDKVVICQKENQFDISDPDFAGKILPSSRASNNTTDHATTVASIMAGSGNSSPDNEGVAPKSQLISASFGSLSPEPDEFLLANNIDLINHSYGTALSYQYSDDAAAYDAQINRLPYLMHIFSSGNSGLESASDGRYKGIAGFANLTGHYKMAKNALLIGAVDENGTVLPNSSRGPAYDGRIKPELVAYSSDGTSFSSALVSGVTAILQDIYQKYFKKKAPVSLIKALLINSADDVDTPGPDFSSGYGALNGYASALALTNKLFREGTVSDGDQLTFNLAIPANVRRMKVTLAWTDPVGTPQSLTSAALFNDLDLDVVLGKTVWQPWVLSTAPNTDSLRLPAQRRRDALNPVEQVTIDNPGTGLCTIRVKATKLQSTKQSFHVCYQFDLNNTFIWLYPTASTTLKAGQVNTLRWESTYATEKGSLSYSLDQGKTWSLITSVLPLKEGKYNWTPPNVLSSCILQITANKLVYPLGSCVISPGMDVVTKRLCADSLLIAWPTVNSPANPVRYLVQQFDMKRNKWTDLTITTQLQAFVKPATNRVLLAVTPILPSGQEGPRTTAISLFEQPVYCYYLDFEATTLDNQSANLYLILSQQEEVKQVIFEKMTPAGFRTLKTEVVNRDSTIFVFDDLSMDNGENTYRVQIRLLSGTDVYTATKKVFRFTDQHPIVFYPNPLIANADILNVAIQQPGDYQLALYDMLGKLLFSVGLPDTNNSVSLPGLSPGLYIARIRLADDIIQTSRLLIR